MALGVVGSLFSGFCGLLFYLVQRSTEADMFPSETKEFCHFTRFEVTCALDQVLLFHRALYGRMRVGTCVRTNFGFVGCYVDVLDILDQRCAGRRSCTFDVVEPTFDNRRPCNVELKNYLEVEYTCITVASVPPGSCETSISETNSLPLNRHDTKKCGTTSYPWRIIAPRLGQRINVTLVDLSNASIKELPPSSTSAAGCQRYVTVNEPLRHTSRDVCVRRSVRENFVYTSESEMVELVFNMSANSGEFLLILTVAGCPDFPASRGSWVRYSADRSSADVGCSEQTDGISWHLVCMGQQWAGHLGNCTSDTSDSSSVSSAAGKHDYFRLNAATMVVLWLVVSSSISLSVLLLGLLIHRQIKKRRRKSRSRGDHHVTTEECVTPPPEEQSSEVHHTSGSCHVYHAFLQQHKGLFTSVGFQPSSKHQRLQANNCTCVCKTCVVGSPCIRQGEQLLVIPKDDEDNCAIRTSDTAKSSLLMGVDHCPRCCTHKVRDDNYE